MLTHDYFRQNIEAIWEKRSRLSAEFRGAIQYVCDKAFHQTLLKYAEMEAAESAKTDT